MARNTERREPKRTYSDIDERIFQQGKTFGSTGTAGERLDASLVGQYVTRLKQNTTYHKYLLGPRGLTQEMIDRFQIGCDTQRITIPIFSEDGKTLLNIRRYLPPPLKPAQRKATERKMLPFKEGLGVSLFPLNFVDWNKPIVLCEGEWDCILLYQYGFNALTITGGVDSWNSAWYQKFAGKAVVIIYDVNDVDDVGQRVAQKRAEGLTGIAKSIKNVHLPLSANEYVGGDITNYFVEEGMSAKDLQKLIRETPKSAIEREHLTTIRADAIVAATPGWLYDDYIPLGGLSLLVGLQGAGKTLIAIHIAAKLSKGQPIMNGNIGCGESVGKSACTLYFNSENPLGSLKSRLNAAGADMRKVYIVDKWHEAEGGRKWLDLNHHLPLIEQLLQQNPSIKFLVFDALNSFIGRANPISDPGMRQVLDPISDLTDKYSVSPFGLMHFNKRGEETHFLHRAGGSVAYIAAARACFYVGYNAKASDKLRPRRRVITAAKLSDIDTDSVEAYGFTIASNDNNAGYLLFEQAPVDITAEQVACGKPHLYVQCAENIKGLLKDGPVASEVVERLLVESERYSRKTYEKARWFVVNDECTVEKVKSGTFEDKGNWFLKLVGDKRPPSILGPQP